jgi:hypothetical protein
LRRGFIVGKGGRYGKLKAEMGKLKWDADAGYELNRMDAIVMIDVKRGRSVIWTYLRRMRFTMKGDTKLKDQFRTKRDGQDFSG